MIRASDCPAASLADKLIIGDFSDEQKIYDLSKEVDIITYEIELANATALSNLEESGFQVHPSPKKHSLSFKTNTVKKNF
ncbi:MAG: hypothetical protein P0116_12965 [Candidatus Nitrosocosmicus sp.]|nr:hypothetical protein [Candidatus Nitrosocosmicus sp.]